jgi:hypothetical protein
MDFSQLGKYRKPDNVLVQELKGEAVLLNLGNSQYYGLDEVGSRMFQLIISEESLNSVYQALIEEYDIEPEKLKLDLETFLTHLLENGLVIEV